ncbi:MAG: FecR domain-containing protein [Bacteroidota bacterium]
MTKKEFFDLVKKYENGACTKDEEKLLFQYCEEVQTKDFATTWNLTEKEEAGIRLLQRIVDSMAKTTNNPVRRPNFNRFWWAAAIFTGLLVTGYLYFQRISTNTIEIPQDAITLELEDGTIEILKEDGTTKVVDKSGKVVGQQNGNQLVYSNTEDSWELAYNTLWVPYGKRFELQLSDGTRVHLNAGSSLKYPVQFLEGKKRNVTVSGEAYLEVAKDTAHPFIVQADNLNVRVLGTQFNVHAYPEDEVSEIVLVEGSVGLYNDTETFEEGNSTLLEPGFRARFDKTDKGITQTRVPTDVYTSWRTGELVFRNMPFENILKKLERHYNVTIINNNVELSREKFNASFGKVPMERVFENLRKYHGIDSKIEGNVITIE